METYCGADCANCPNMETCAGCIATGGRPFGGECIAAECIKAGGMRCFEEAKAALIKEFNALGVPDMPEVTELCLLNGAYVNLEYTLPGGQKAKLLDDKAVYLGYQLEKPNDERCFGLVADSRHLLVCEYGCGGADPEIIVFKKR